MLTFGRLLWKKKGETHRKPKYQPWARRIDPGEQEAILIAKTGGKCAREHRDTVAKVGDRWKGWMGRGSKPVANERAGG